MAVSVSVSLLSGKSASLSAAADETIGSLKRRAQIALGVGSARLVLPDGGCIIDGEQPVKRLCRNGDTLTLHITESRVQSTNLALAAIRGDATVAVYGHRLYGGDCRAVQDQLFNVQHIQSTDRAFAAIRGDGNVVTWETLTMVVTAALFGTS